MELWNSAATYRIGTILLTNVFFSSCVGEITSKNTATSLEGSVPPTSSSNSNATDSTDNRSNWPVPLRRLTRFEYNNTIRDLLNDDGSPANEFGPDEVSAGFENNTGSTASDLTVEQYARASEVIATRATADVQSLVKCNPSLGPACAKIFIADFGRRAFRRPLLAEESARMLAVFSHPAAGGDFKTGIRLVLQTMLQSPQFLYRIELPASPSPKTERAALSPYELASRLSYLLLGSMPDEALFSAAESGRLQTKADVEVQAKRLLALPRAHAVLSNFFEQWLLLRNGVVKDATIFPTYSQTLRASMLAETNAFFESVVWGDDGRLETLFTAPYSFVDSPLAELYGLAKPVSSGLVRTDLPADQRSGFLTHASLLSGLAKPNQTSPIHRGKFVRERLLCQELPLPPPDVDLTPPPPAKDATTRSRFSAHSANPRCAGCHQQIDPIGFGFENYDGLGRFLQKENGISIDSSGEVLSAGDASGRFVGLVQLSRQLSKSELVRSCVTAQWFRYALGRTERAGDKGSIKVLKDAFSRSDFRVRDLLLAITQTDAFLYNPEVESPL
jgi:Protein of unknown function (DUF1592)/Protein of unknown function (DUF1588)/Protein of unknown function (DUF1595)/Protein of unknown function (DUF1587)/Protein of unknown function (DUF1585)